METTLTTEDINEGIKPFASISSEYRFHIPKIDVFEPSCTIAEQIFEIPFSMGLKSKHRIFNSHANLRHNY